MDNNKTEDQIRFEKEVNEALKNFDNLNAIKVCDTPDILLEIGFEQKPWLYTKKHLNEAIKPIVEGGHGLKIEQIYNMPTNIKNPAMVLKNRNKNRQDCPIIVFDDVDEEKNPLFLFVKKDGKGNYNFEEIDSNFIKSLYGHEAFNKYFKDVIENNGLIYYDKEKIRNLETLARVQFPNCISNYESNKILQHIDKNVNNVYLKAVNNVHITRCSAKELYKNINGQDNNTIIVNNEKRKDISNEK